MTKKESRDVQVAEERTNWRPAIIPALALIAIGVLPDMLKVFYEPYASGLVTAYVILVMLFMVPVIGGLSLMMYRDLSSRYQKVFRLLPSKQPTRETEGQVFVEADSEKRQYRTSDQQKS